MDSDTQIKAHYEDVEVIAQAYAGAEGELVAECAPRQCAAGASRVLSHEPCVARVYEGGSVEVAYDGETVFDVELKFGVTDLVEI